MAVLRLIDQSGIRCWWDNRDIVAASQKGCRISVSTPLRFVPSGDEGNTQIDEDEAAVGGGLVVDRVLQRPGTI